MRERLLGLELSGAVRADPPPLVDRERVADPGDAWTVARRREWASTLVEDTLRTGRRVLVRLDDESPASHASFSLTRHVLYWRDGHTTEGAPLYLIAGQLSAHIVTRWGADRLLLEGEDHRWHGLPMTPGFRRVDKRLA